MSILEHLNITRCKTCGKLFLREPEKILCRTCAAVAAGEPRPVPRNEPLTTTWEVQDIGLYEDWYDLDPPLNSDPLAAALDEQDAAEEDPPCIQCRKRPAIEGMDMCLTCCFSLYNALGDAASSLYSQIRDFPSNAGATAGGVRESLRQKKERATSGRINPVAVHRKW